MCFRLQYILVLLMFPLLALGQDYKVDSFEIVPNDLTARTKGRVDNNGRKCGLIKVYVKDAITATDGPVIGEVVDRGMEKWVYVSHDAKQVELLFKEHMPLRVIFDDFNFTTLSGNMTYVMKLKEVRVNNTSPAGTTNMREQGALTLTQPSNYVGSNQITSEPATKQDLKQNFGKPLEVLDPVIRNLIKNMVYVEGGTFMMGTNKWGTGGQQKSVESFSIGKYEVTQKEWNTVMGNNPSNFNGDDLPVENVSWDDCRKFIQNLNALTGRNFRLPTQEEWEYAARGGNRSRGYIYSGGKDIKKVAWFDKNSGEKTHSVGQKTANELGLYDMSGNVSEWTSSNFINEYNKGWKYFIIRGGSWSDSEGEWDQCSVWESRHSGSSARKSNLGLRLAL